MIYGILFTLYFAFIDTLNTVQILYTQITYCISIIAVNIDKCLKAVLLTAIKKPIYRAFLINLAVVFVKVIQEIVAYNLTARITLIAESLCDIVKVFFKCIFTVNDLYKLAESAHYVIVKVFCIGYRYAVIFIGNKALVFSAVPSSSGIGKSFHIKTVSSEHTAHSIAYQAFYLSRQVCLAYSHILVLYFGCQLVLQAVYVYEYAV